MPPHDLTLVSRPDTPQQLPPLSQLSPAPDILRTCLALRTVSVSRHSTQSRWPHALPPLPLPGVPFPKPLREAAPHLESHRAMLPHPKGSWVLPTLPEAQTGLTGQAALSQELPHGSQDPPEKVGPRTGRLSSSGTYGSPGDVWPGREGPEVSVPPKKCSLSTGCVQERAVFTLLLGLSTRHLHRGHQPRC